MGSKSAQVHHSDVSGQSGTTGYEGVTVFLFIADGGDEDLLVVENSKLGQARSARSLEDHVLQMARGDPGPVHRVAQRHTVYGEVSVLQ